MKKTHSLIETFIHKEIEKKKLEIPSQNKHHYSKKQRRYISSINIIIISLIIYILQNCFQIHFFRLFFPSLSFSRCRNLIRVPEYIRLCHCRDLPETLYPRVSHPPAIVEIGTICDGMIFTHPPEEVHCSPVSRGTERPGPI